MRGPPHNLTATVTLDQESSEVSHVVAAPITVEQEILSGSDDDHDTTLRPDDRTVEQLRPDIYNGHRTLGASLDVHPSQLKLARVSNGRGERPSSITESLIDTGTKKGWKPSVKPFIKVAYQPKK